MHPQVGRLRADRDLEGVGREIGIARQLFEGGAEFRLGLDRDPPPGEDLPASPATADGDVLQCVRRDFESGRGGYGSPIPSATPRAA